ncbi:Rieske (2Fe-2S) protein [Streptomyces purpureus]|uniref:Rieske (2Fe-2S) protein n=1 Tax=Streptomyces purpureus TaxID=1951 RepID=UPI0016715A12|nr:Rieske (2Fe-2S) protein [Streptomyces purpureus]
MSTDATPRRTVLLAGAGSVAALATGCGDDGQETAPEPETAPELGSPPPEPPASAPASPGQTLAKTSEIPVGGGTIFEEQKVVVTQPEAGQFKAFSAVCTHQACLVSRVADGTINCPCHASRFSITDGSVAGGPARRPLPEEEITVSGDVISLA